ncbi:MULTISPECIES: DUF4856 domain-containing protein [Mesonia]|uniref:Uncharacterized protein n=1 Tax=Mesonia oceanica TaxID=2687242 RepID=A0AC61YAE7_9FLAO|nr:MULTISPECIES: DUF4856 domain-containing protein [Mesonia]MAN26700.1 DUF4856 domain-containing protein [Mesonia sp.]MAQ39818.1 DUF4856 domain-containing protein [Mesonia sp.]MBJ96676.1 DUF4856 domain-containing protein [Flavobacteriaceae bacterium]VVV01374.1 hypothetical protein FVB9532_02664 [Mesonia oceanica]|tara:strand:- start:13331 stop:14533 length:1203 start_codon:yes stop_codon:yes gene_type:complete
MIKSISLSFLTIFLLASCSSDDDNSAAVENLEVPATYTFERNGESTVSYSGQTTRITMAKALAGQMMDETSSEEQLLNMLNNENNPFTEEELNTSSKNIKSKLAASAEYFSTNTVESNAYKQDFENFLINQANEVYPNWNTLAEAGIAGQVIDGSKTRYISGKGLEYNQAYLKGLMGALLSDQMLNNYLSSLVLDEGDNKANNDAEIVEEGKNYTTMEHKWDEAYGYLYGDASVPTANPMASIEDNEDKFLFNYIRQVDADDDFTGIAQETFDAFKKGRAAIVAGKYDIRDEQIAIIQENISMIFAVRAIHYLQSGKVAIQEENVTGAFHALSEAYGFLYSIRFSHNPANDQPYLSASDVNAYLADLMEDNGFWSVTPEKLDEISEAIASAYSISVSQID